MDVRVIHLTRDYNGMTEILDVEAFVYIGRSRQILVINDGRIVYRNKRYYRQEDADDIVLDILSCDRITDIMIGGAVGYRGIYEKCKYSKLLFNILNNNQSN